MTAPTRWCIWYQDGTTFSSDDGEPQDVPGSGIVVIAQDGGNHDTPYATAGEQWRTVFGYDWYIFDKNRWFSTNMVGLVQYVTEPGCKIVKVGRWVPHELYEKLRAEAAAWGY